MKTSDFYYDLPQELIAQDPLRDRSGSRLLVMDWKNGVFSHRHFYDIKEYLKPGDCLVINNTRVIPARLYGCRAKTGGHVEVLLLKRVEEDLWECLVKPGRKCRPGEQLSFGDGRLKAEVVDVVEDGNRTIRFFYEGIWEEILDSLGEMPLPPYITHKLADRNRYQTVYAKYDGSAAAPTAGLHFTPELMQEIRDMGVVIAEITLHVGLGTFRPVKVENVDEHHMHSEYYEISKESCDIINKAKAAGGRIISVGTTSTRTLETAAGKFRQNNPEYSGTDILEPMSGWTDIFIYPGYEFLAIDGLITNFHLPESTLLMLVSAFCGKENVMNAYEEAVRQRYRFFSFGDAMLIL